jgi:hypothetical protein
MIPDLPLKPVNGILHEPIHSRLPLIVVSLNNFLNLLNSLALILLTCNENQCNSMWKLESDSISLSASLECVLLINHLIQIFARQL